MASNTRVKISLNIPSMTQFHSLLSKPSESGIHVIPETRLKLMSMIISHLLLPIIVKKISISIILCSYISGKQLLLQL